MQMRHLHDMLRPPDQAMLARPVLDGDQSSVRIIRLGPGQALPPHRHGASDLMLYAVSGAGQLDSPDGAQAFDSGALAYLRGDEELRLRNVGSDELTLLAFIAPKLG
jgi:quercetin dioxygenase-like cupin family protein